ncbi:RNA methyltransferase [Aphanothece sacrum]|uniref:tRNA (cytidine/uridine-2'-O-)-methyltransferase TrmJ n=1 Tax=Aphanothece sacrum FPU1 TaxID=1920663 RepID=A0A401IJR8_APHSA|nr:RNA methyltransferase [Aphanothece sacrum]GBF81420.1 RNA methyltransferase, TrmH family protein [Aphanothece sacrum FPU1]GBF85389.1 RNA methyltransferase, TrmH family [Aphanothece sacrum FPU3]
MTNNSLKAVRIILVETAGPLNVGSVARVMKNMGLNQLILVNPRCDRFSDEARRMAVHGLDVLEQSQLVGSLPEALRGCQQAIATTSRSRTLLTPLESPKEALPWLLTPNLTSALIFGPEDRGLNNEELNYAQRFVGIPANPDYPSLNLAQAVAVCAYELYQAAQSVREPLPTIELASLDILEGYYQHLEASLLKIGYLYPHTVTARMEKIRRLYNRANLTPEEVALLRGILGQMDWMWQHLSQQESHKSQPS